MENKNKQKIDDNAEYDINGDNNNITIKKGGNVSKSMWVSISLGGLTISGMSGFVGYQIEHKKTIEAQDELDIEKRFLQEKDKKIEFQNTLIRLAFNGKKAKEIIAKLTNPNEKTITPTKTIYEDEKKGKWTIKELKLRIGALGVLKEFKKTKEDWKLIDAAIAKLKKILKELQEKGDK